jgi:hypothetical protein
MFTGWDARRLELRAPDFAGVGFLPSTVCLGTPHNLRPRFYRRLRGGTFFYRYLGLKPQAEFCCPFLPSSS